MCHSAQGRSTNLSDGSRHDIKLRELHKLQGSNKVSGGDKFDIQTSKFISVKATTGTQILISDRNELLIIKKRRLWCTISQKPQLQLDNVYTMTRGKELGVFKHENIVPIHIMMALLALRVCTFD